MEGALDFELQTTVQKNKFLLSKFYFHVISTIDLGGPLLVCVGP